MNSCSHVPNTETSLFTDLLSKVPVGIIALDDAYQAVFFNQKALECMKEITGSSSVNQQEICNEFITSKLSQKLHYILNRDEEIPYDAGHRIGIVPFMWPKEDGRLGVFYFLYILSAKCVQEYIDHIEIPADTQPLLSKREQQILNLIIQGFSNQEIAEHLSLSIHTVKTHNENIYQKLDVDGKEKAIIKYLSFARDCHR